MSSGKYQLLATDMRDGSVESAGCVPRRVRVPSLLGSAIQLERRWWMWMVTRIGIYWLRSWAVSIRTIITLVQAVWLRRNADRNAFDTVPLFQGLGRIADVVFDGFADGVRTQLSHS